jgi:hypothetical protein
MCAIAGIDHGRTGGITNVLIGEAYWLLLFGNLQQTIRTNLESGLEQCGSALTSIFVQE